MHLQAGLFGPKCSSVLPSPPESPSIYACSPKRVEHGRNTTRLVSRNILSTPSSSTTFNSVESARQFCDERASASQSEDSPQRDGRTPPHSSRFHQVIAVDDSYSQSSNMKAPELLWPDQVPYHLHRDGPLEQRPTRASSTASHPTPQLVLTQAEHLSEGDELFTHSEEEEDVAGGMEAAKSGAERLAEKRKMKRFRLTHAQTRYLISEFSCQPHPDAAQRDRLSRDIPGLNPRQVQVWFQNRRAKLKRLTIDDQERIRRSRALPENFNFSQTLQPIFKETPPSYESALTDPLMLGPGMSQRPRLQLGTGHFSVASNRMDSALTNIAPTLLSAAGSPNPSPVSSLNEEFEHSGPCFSATQYPLVTSPQFTNPFSRSHGLSASSPAFQRQGRPSSQNSMIELSGQVVATASPSNPSLVNNTYGDGDLPPLQFTRTPFQTRDGQRLGAIQTTEGFPHESGMSISQQCISPLSSPSTISYNQSQMHYPSSSGFRASSYYQSPDPNFWQESQISHPGYQHGQRLQPHRTTEQRPERRYSQSSFFQDPSVNRHDQRSYSHSGQYYSKTSSSAQAMNTESYGQTQRTILGKEAAIDIETQPRPDATRLRARSDTYPAYYKAQQ